MDAVKFVPPGGHRACLNCSAAKAKCVFPDVGSEPSGYRPSRSSDGAGHPPAVSAANAANAAAAAYRNDNLSAPDSGPLADGVPACPRCERCERFGRECLVPVRPRKKRRVGPVRSTTRSSTSEETSEAAGSAAAVAPAAATASIAVRIGSGSRPAHAPPQPASSHSAAPGTGLTKHCADSKGPPPPSARTQAPPSLALSPALPSSLPAAAPPNALKSLIHATLHMESREADVVLRFYRDYFSHLILYADVVKPGVKAADLQTGKPTVWLAIVFATSYHDFEYQHKLARAFVFRIGEQVFQNGHRSLELLQGLLIFLNWFTTNNFVLQQYTALIHVVMALVSDLGLDKVEFSRTQEKDPLDAYATKSMHGPSVVAPERGHTADEGRALAGCYCLSNFVASSGIMVSAPQYSLQLQDTCRRFELEERSSLDSLGNAVSTPDYHLAITVRLYYLISRVAQVQRDADLCRGRFLVPASTHVDLFIGELNRLWAVVPLGTQREPNVKLLYHTAEISIYKLGLANVTSPVDGDNPLGDSSNDSNITGYDIPVRCFLAVRSFFDTFFTLPTAIYYRLPVTVFSQLVHADTTLARLTAHFRGNTCPAGTPRGVTLPAFNDVMEALARRFQKARTDPHPLGHAIRNNMYDTFAVRLRSFKQLDLSSRRDGTPRPSAAAATTATAATATTAVMTATPATPADGSGHKHNGSSPSTLFSHSSGGGREGNGDACDGLGTYNDGDMSQSAAREGLPELTGATLDEMIQEEWWAWFQDFQSTLLSPHGGSNSVASGGGSMITGGSGGTARRVGAGTGNGSVGSINSLLNTSNDPEGSYPTCIQR